MRLDICFKAWDIQEAGYIFISSKESGSWRDYPFNYSGSKQDKDKIIEKATELTGDLYWSLCTFSRPKRREEYVNHSSVLYADLDFVNPLTVSRQHPEFKPSVAWKSSSDRYQALWYLDNKLSPDAHNKINKALSYFLGADRGGWDLTQVLRIPDTTNFKYDPPQAGSVLWNTNKTYDYQGMLKKLSDVSLSSDVNVSVNTNTDAGDWVALLSKYRKKIPAKTAGLLQYGENRVEVGHRSEVLWAIESELIKAKIPLADVVALVAGSSWNKFRGRSDEFKRLTTEVQKVYTSLVASDIPDSGDTPTAASTTATEVSDNNLTEEGLSGLPIVNFSPFMSSVTAQPGWMIRDIWLKRSHGIVAGDPKTFKSTVAMDIAVSVASGRKLWDKFEVEDQGPVVIIQNENSDWIMKDRMERIMASKGLVGNVKYRSRERELEVKFAPDLPISFLNNYGFSFSDPLHLRQLEEYIINCSSGVGGVGIGRTPALIILDPLYLMFDGELNSAKELGPALQWLLGIKNKYNCSIMLIHHWNKGGTASRGGQRMLGSVALHGWTESGIFLQDDTSPVITGGGEGKTGESIARLVMEREFRASGILPKLSLNILSSEDLHLCSMGLVSDSPRNSGGSNSDFKGELFKLLIEAGDSGVNLQKLSRLLKIPRGEVRKLLDDPQVVVSDDDIAKILVTDHK